jgi:hypothetical protein
MAKNDATQPKKRPATIFYKFSNRWAILPQNWKTYTKHKFHHIFSFWASESAS